MDFIIYNRYQAYDVQFKKNNNKNEVFCFQWKSLHFVVITVVIVKRFVSFEMV